MLEIGGEGLKAMQAYTARGKDVEALAKNFKARKEALEGKKLDEGLEQFEAYFINMMFKEMRKSVPKYDTYLTGGKEHKMFQEMMDEKVSEDMAKSGGLGLKQLLKDEVSQLANLNKKKTEKEELN